jgi:hypothetical protein
MAPDHWYTFSDVFSSAPQELWDGSLAFSADRQFKGADVHALTGVTRSRSQMRTTHDQQQPRIYRYLQFTLSKIDAREIIPPLDTYSIASRLLRENMVCIPDSHFAFDIMVKSRESACYATGKVCVQLSLADAGLASGRRHRENTNEVDYAYRRGLLDEAGKDRADTRLGLRPMKSKWQALQDSGYLPDEDWQIDIIFSYWHRQGTAELTRSPLDEDGFRSLRLQFRESDQEAVRELRP